MPRCYNTLRSRNIGVEEGSGSAGVRPQRMSFAVRAFVAWFQLASPAQSRTVAVLIRLVVVPGDAANADMCRVTRHFQRS